ncbi:Glypican domain containing protein [Trichuris trichiura]|uniref:Glypican domain containing protein n=1 Tax=Trichuris trichiura TaxID=36087 RepID=A0A077Z6P9_TRITR|nr:Glypican domain containing protein [Trichuris trichiura]
MARKMHQMFEEHFSQISRPIIPHLEIFTRQLQSLFATRSHAPVTIKPWQGTSSKQEWNFRSEPTGGNAKLRRAVERFFSGIFPPVYACIINADCPRGYKLNANYSKCVRDAALKIEPFGDIPTRAGLLLKEAAEDLQYVRFFVEEAIDIVKQIQTLWRRWASETVYSSQIMRRKGCIFQLVQLYVCPLCILGGNEKVEAANLFPCNSQCLSTVSECVQKFHAPLHESWNEAMHVLQKFVVSNSQRRRATLEEALIGPQGIIASIKDAIENDAVTAGPSISIRLFDECGPFKTESLIEWVERKNPPAEAMKFLSLLSLKPSSTKLLKVRSVDSPDLSRHVKKAAQNMSKFFGNWLQRVPEMICELPSASAKYGQKCLKTKKNILKSRDESYISTFLDNSHLASTNETIPPTVSDDMPVLSTTTPHSSLPQATQEPKTSEIVEEEHLQAEDDDQDGEDLPAEIINAGVSSRPMPPLSSADLEEKLRRLTETMEKIQRGDDIETDPKAKSQTGAWPPRIFEQSGNRPPWDQSDDEDDQLQGSGSGETEVSPSMRDKDHFEGETMKATPSSDQQWTTEGRRTADGSQRKPADGTTPKTDGTDSSYSATGMRTIAMLLCTVAIYRWLAIF